MSASTQRYRIECDILPADDVISCASLLPRLAKASPAMLLTSRTTKPKYSTTMVDRPRLYRQLDCWQTVRAIAIHAPAGYGKSSLISRWIDVAGLNGQSVWLSLDENDTDPRDFVHYVAAAIDGCLPGTLAAVKPILDDMHGTPHQALARLITALNHMASAGDEAPHTILVLDDLHCVDSTEVNALMLTLLEQGPDNLHLVLLARHRTRLPLARLVAHEQVKIVTAAEMSFTEEEIGSYLAGRNVTPPTPSELAQIAQRSEGWVTALQLAILSLQQSSTAAAVSEALQGDHGWLAAFLTEEVLQRQTPAQRRFLLQTSILNSFNASLCAAVTGDNDAHARLMELDRADLFLITLDEERGWFRYHHLFQELLQHNLVGHEDQATVTTLHRRAAAWLAEAGRVDDAVEHWLAADAVDEAAALVEAKVQQLLIRAPHEARQLITRLPEAVLGRYPRLILDRCFLAILFDDRQMHVYAEEAKETLQVQENAGALTPAMQGEWLVLQGSVAFRRGDLDAALNFVESAEVCLDFLPNYIGGILSFLSMHLRRHSSDQPTALAQGDRAISAFERAGLIAGAVAVRRELARWAMLAGDRQAATERFQAIFDIGIGDTNRATSELAVAYLYAADNCYWQDRLTEAQAYQQEAMALADRLQNNDVIQCAAAMTRLYAAVALFDGAKTEACEQEVRLDLSTVASHSLSLFLLELETRRQILLGRPDLAWRTIQMAGLDAVDERTVSQPRVVIFYLRAYLARGVDPVAITSLLTAALDEATRSGQRFRRLQLLALLAWQQVLLGCEEDAKRTITEAANIAHETGYVRVLLDIPELARLLLGMNNASALPHNGHDRAAVADAPELTAQERNVLRLLAADCTYRQIANELVISLNTVRTHVRHIYKKLGVRRRDHAVAQGREYGILPPKTGSAQIA